MNTVWVLDLDNTLYPFDNGLFRLIDDRIEHFMTSRLGLPAAGVSELRVRYRQELGLTVIGLMRDHGVDPEEYSRFVHDVPLGDFLSPDPSLDRALADLEGERVIFTNGSVAHAEAVLDALGVASRFSRIFDLVFMDYIPKPREHGYRKLLAELGAEPEQCRFVDDMAENLDTALALGMETVLVGPRARPPHRHARSIQELAAFPSPCSFGIQEDSDVERAMQLEDLPLQPQGVHRVRRLPG